jgi:hypothetical protein
MRPISRSIALGLAAIALAALACTLPNLGAPAGETADPAKAATAIAATVSALGDGAEPGEPAQDLAEASATPATSATPAPTAAPELPVGLRQGLAGLNSYRMRTVISLNGPGPQDSSRETTEYAYVAEGERMHTHVESLISTTEEPNSEPSVQDLYRIGSLQCSLPPDEEGVSPLATIDPIQQEMTDVMSQMMDFVLYVENPELVGEEIVNLVPSRHYRFEITGLGDTSGAEVTQSSGEYWTALDGNYLVKYILVLETRSAPEGSAEAKVMRVEITLDLAEVNQPISIEMPADCK